MAGTFPSEVWADVLFYAAGPGGEKEGMTEKERAQLRDTRLSVIQVCRGWKRASLKYLYSSPILDTSSSLIEFNSAIRSADARWDNLRKSPHSLQSAAVRTLDISHLRPSPSTSQFHDIQNQPWMLNSLICNLLPLLPFLTKIVLPSGIPGGGSLIGGGNFLRSLKSADCSETLVVLENLGMLMKGVVDGEGRDPVVSLLDGLPKLEVLGLIGGGLMDLPPSNVTFEAYPQPPLDLHNLLTLHLRGVQTGLLLQTLINSLLPQLKHLSLSSYHSTPSDLTTPFLATHGPSLTSLTYLPLPDFPRPILPLPLETLSLCPSLTSLTLHIPPNHPPPPPEFFNSDAASSSCLERLSLPRPAKSTLYEPLMASLRHVPRLKEVVFQGFTYLPTGSPAANGSGLSGTIRTWAATLGRRGVAVRDSRGKGCPGLVETNGFWVAEQRKGVVKGTRFRRSSWEEEESEGGG